MCAALKRSPSPCGRPRRLRRSGGANLLEDRLAES
jgi:hypothetical protein